MALGAHREQSPPVSTPVIDGACRFGQVSDELDSLRDRIAEKHSGLTAGDSCGSDRVCILKVARGVNTPIAHQRFTTKNVYGAQTVGRRDGRDNPYQTRLSWL